MIQSSFDFLEKFISDFTWKKFILLFSLILIVFIGVSIYEIYTSSFQLGKLERSINAINNINKVKDLKKSEKAKLSLLRRIILDKLYNINSNKNTNFDYSTFGYIIQALVMASPYLIAILYLLPSHIKGDTENKNMILGLFIFTVPMAIIGFLLPTEWGAKLNLIFIPLLVNLFFCNLVVIIRN